MFQMNCGRSGEAREVSELVAAQWPRRSGAYLAPGVLYDLRVVRWVAGKVLVARVAFVWNLGGSPGGGAGRDDLVGTKDGVALFAKDVDGGAG